MAIEDDHPGYTGYRETIDQPSEPAQASSLEPAPSVEGYRPFPGANGQDATADHVARDARDLASLGDEEVQDAVPTGDGAGLDGVAAEISGSETSDGELDGEDASGAIAAKLNGFTKPASDCINKARRIARELNHTSVSAAHLVLAMTLDPRSSRRLRDLGVDVDLVRETAVQLLAKYNCLYSTGDRGAADRPAPAPDLADILEAASRYAQEREDEEEINISDLLDAFPKSGSRARLIYGQGESIDQLPAVIRRVEQWLAPQLEQLFAGLEERVFAHVEERLGPLFNEARDELSVQLVSLRQVSTQLGEQAAGIGHLSPKPEPTDTRWPWR